MSGGNNQYPNNPYIPTTQAYSHPSATYPTQPPHPGYAYAHPQAPAQGPYNPQPQYHYNPHGMQAPSVPQQPYVQPGQYQPQQPFQQYPHQVAQPGPAYYPQAQASSAAPTQPAQQTTAANEWCPISECSDGCWDDINEVEMQQHPTTNDRIAAGYHVRCVRPGCNRVIGRTSETKHRQALHPNTELDINFLVWVKPSAIHKYLLVPIGRPIPMNSKFTHDQKNEFGSHMAKCGTCHRWLKYGSSFPRGHTNPQGQPCKHPAGDKYPTVYQRFLNPYNFHKDIVAENQKLFAPYPTA